MCRFFIMRIIPYNGFMKPVNNSSANNLYDFFVYRKAEEACRILDFGRDQWQADGGSEAGRTVCGQSGDATDAAGVLRALDLIIEGNRLRSRHGLNALAVTDELMAMAAVNANMSAVIRAHWMGLRQSYGLQYTGENLAWGYDNPFEGWYEEEGRLYESGSRSGVGHYLNLVNPEQEPERDYVACGFGLVTKPGILVTACHEFAAAYGAGTTPKGVRITTENAIPAEEYRDAFMKFITE